MTTRFGGTPDLGPVRKNRSSAQTFAGGPFRILSSVPGKLTKLQADQVCCSGQGPKACAYLQFSVGAGHTCAKLNPPARRSVEKARSLGIARGRLGACPVPGDVGTTADADSHDTATEELASIVS